jgi:hypothetical protein
MKPKRAIPSHPRCDGQQLDWSPSGLGLDSGRYEAVVNYLFERPVPQGQQQEWYWDDDLEVFEATPLEWTRFQAAIFANSAKDLAKFSNEQVGMGLNYLMSNAVSDVPYAAIDADVPLDEALRMMRAMPLLWRDCIGPRMASDQAPVGHSEGWLGYACYMWFDVWPTYRNVRDVRAWADAVWDVLKQMLAVPCRAVQIAALHGIGHAGRDLDRWQEVDAAVSAFVMSVRDDDEELRNYAEAARTGNVQ